LRIRKVRRLQWRSSLLRAQGYQGPWSRKRSSFVPIYGDGLSLLRLTSVCEPPQLWTQ